MIRYTSVEDFYTRAAEAEERAAAAESEHPATAQGRNARAAEYRRLARKALKANGTAQGGAQ